MIPVFLFAPPASHAWIPAWSVPNMGEPCDRSAPTEPPPAPKLWQLVQPAAVMSAAPGSALIAGTVVTFDPLATPGAMPPAIVSAIRTAGTESPTATPHGRR